MCAVGAVIGMTVDVACNPTVDSGGAADGPTGAGVWGRSTNWGVARDGATGRGLLLRPDTMSRRWSPHSGSSALACADDRTERRRPVARSRGKRAHLPT
jgi:hypothetical protein